MTELLREPVLWLVLVGGAIYGRGFLALLAMTRRHGHPIRHRLRQLLATVLAMVGTVGALSPFVDGRADQSFAMHMAQHLVLLVAVPPLLVLGAPWTPALRGLPQPLRERLVRGPVLAPVRRAFQWLNRPWPAFLALNANLWAWHDPRLYDLTLSSPAVHYLEHTLFVGTGVLWWLQVVTSPPLRAHLDAVKTLPAQVSCMVSGWILAMWLSYAPTPIYSGYAGAAHLLGGMSALNDQRLGASLMWVIGGFPYGLSVAVRAYGWLARPEHDWRPHRRPAQSWVPLRVPPSG